MKNELNLTYLVPKTLYHNFRQFLNGSQLQELDRANMTHLQEPQASTLATTADTTVGNTTGTFIDTSILTPPRPTASNPPVETPKAPVETPKAPVETPKPTAEETPVKSPKLPDEPSPIKLPQAPNLFGNPVRRGSYYECEICGHKSHGKEKHLEHMLQVHPELTHSSTPVQSVKPRNHSSRPSNKVRVEVIKRQQKEEEQLGGWTKYIPMKFTS